ncbi:MAG: hypothetical protein HY397_01280 [Candidatus Doudnabacteria bacterium]|nr:hypothetical protein [Candidatus Doudnabacteria bacterium]
MPKQIPNSSSPAEDENPPNHRRSGRRHPPRRRSWKLVAPWFARWAIPTALRLIFLPAVSGTVEVRVMTITIDRDQRACGRFLFGLNLL